MTSPLDYDYGTPEYYAEMFSDILADVDAGCEDGTLKSPTAENIYRGFLLAINSWLDYHEKQAAAYKDLQRKVRSALD